MHGSRWMQGASDVSGTQHESAAEINILCYHKACAPNAHLPADQQKAPSDSWPCVLHRRRGNASGPAYLSSAVKDWLRQDKEDIAAAAIHRSLQQRIRLAQPLALAVHKARSRGSRCELGCWLADRAATRLEAGHRPCRALQHQCGWRCEGGLPRTRGMELALGFVLRSHVRLQMSCQGRRYWQPVLV